MSDLAEQADVPTGRAGEIPRDVRRRLKMGCFVLEALNALGAAYYFNDLFFYMQGHFGFGNKNNLLLTAVYGFFYMISAWGVGRLAQKHGHFVFLRLGFSTVFAMMVVGALIPRFFGYTRTALFAEVGVLVIWTLGLCGTWPMLQALVSRNESPEEKARTAGIYNIIWAVASAVAFLTGGALLDWLGGEILFWVAAGVHLIQLVLLVPLQRMYGNATPSTTQNAKHESIPPLNPRPIAKARMFLRLAWIANPFAYVAIYGMLPMIPKLSERLGMSPALAGLVYSVWFWTRLGAFVWFWRWPGWHYRFGLLLSAFLAMIAGFAVILLCPQVWLIIAAEVVFGVAVGLIYYSSLFYSMDAGESTGKHGGVHEAAIGMGTLLGPMAGVIALRMFPTEFNAGTWNICILLGVGLTLFLAIRFRAARG